jgi:hypothetical protein
LQGGGTVKITLQEKITVLQGRGTVKIMFCKGKNHRIARWRDHQNIISEYHFTGWLPLNIIQNVVISKYHFARWLSLNIIRNVVISEYHRGIMWLSANIILQGGYL